MSSTTVMKAPMFKNLFCAYTGKPAEVRQVTSGGAPLYFCPDAFDPATAFAPTTTELFRLLGIRNGVENALRGEGALVCPYTGAKMAIKEAKGLGFVAVGGFSPSTLTPEPSFLARGMLMRSGVLPPDAPKAGAALRLVAREIEIGETADGPAVTMDAAMAKAEDVLAKDYKPRPQITVPSGAPRRRGRPARRKA